MSLRLAGFLAGNAAGLACMCAAHWYFWPDRILAGLAADVTGILVTAAAWKAYFR